MSRYWWQRSSSNKGIHWCKWVDLCDLKDGGGFGFRQLDKFNVALLAKQGWRLLCNPTSLVARVLKSKYYANKDFMECELGNQHSMIWCSIWSARGPLQKGCSWRVGTGSSIPIGMRLGFLGIDQPLFSM